MTLKIYVLLSYFGGTSTYGYDLIFQIITKEKTQIFTELFGISVFKIFNDLWKHMAISLWKAYGAKGMTA